ncbi:MAG TPA: hypothetical protein VHN14_15960, partial [Kofleriaceae bacterium]|nr:hypothetical protein [Kofleriaceae bacterium]
MHRSLLVCLCLAACEGPAGPPGPAGQDGSGGGVGEPGGKGDPGNPAGPSPWLTGGGVAIAVTGVTASAQGATIAFTLHDGNGVALDRDGLLTEGKVDISFVFAQLAQNADGSPG